MASLPQQPSTGILHKYDWEFVNEPPEVVQCEICAQLLQEPQLPICCGQNYLCVNCVTQIRLRSDRLSGKPLCPFCRTEDFQTAVSVDLKNTILALEVRCPHHDDGCNWTGRIQDAGRHLDRDCNFHPISCPKGCTAVLQRRVLEQHWHECPNLVIYCPFRLAGCSETIERKNIHVHTQYGIHQHLFQTSEKISKLSTRYSALTKSLQASHKELLHQKEAKIATLNHKISEVQETISYLEKSLHTAQKEITTLREEQMKRNAQRTAELRLQDEQLLNLRELHVPIQAQLEATPTPPIEACTLLPVTLVLDSFEERKAHNEEWLSPPFYSHRGGYKMYLSVHPNGFGTGLGTHISIYVHFMTGEYDDGLEWPFEGRITILLLNQQNVLTNLVFQSFQSTKGHYRRVVELDSQKTLTYRTRVFDGDHSSGWGNPTFMSHALLGPFLSRNTLKIMVLPILFLPL